MKVQSVMFSSDALQISYAEDRDQDETGIIEFRTLDIPYHVCSEEMKDLEDSCRAVIDAALLARRRPVERFRGTR